MILQALILSVKDRLAQSRTDDVMRELRLLAAHALGLEPSRITLHLRDEVSVEMQAHFRELVELRRTHMPVSKIIQKRQFWGRDLKVDRDVLDPRGDTETLIAACLELGPQARVLDLGTGSGAIGLTLAAEWPRAEVVCTDISTGALDVARINMNSIGVADAVTLVRSDWFENVQGQFDLITANPPYIAQDEWNALDFEVRGFDPRIALTDEGDGLSAYRVIAAEAGAFLGDGGRVMVEIGWTQGCAVSKLFKLAGFTEIKCLPDMAGRSRVVSCMWRVS